MKNEKMKTEECPGMIIQKTDNGGILIAVANHSVIEVLRVKIGNMPSMWAAELIDTEKLPINIFDILN